MSVIDGLRVSVTQENKNSIRREAERVVASRPVAWPAIVTKVQGSMVTVAVQVTTSAPIKEVTVPLAGAEYIRYPVQAGCVGMLVPADVSITHLTETGPNIPPRVVAPLGIGPAQMFVPFAKMGWSPINPDWLQLYGASGVVIHPQLDVTDTFIKVKDGSIEVVAGDSSITLNQSGITINAAAPITINSTSEVSVLAPQVNING